jgi:hypothetical protein
MGNALRLYQEKLSFSKLVAAIFLMFKIFRGIATPNLEKLIIDETLPNINKSKHQKKGGYNE